MKCKKNVKLLVICGCPYLSVAVVGVPAGPKVLLPSYVPKQEVCVAHCYLLHVAANGGRRMDGFLCQTGGVGEKNMKSTELSTQTKLQTKPKFWNKKSGHSLLIKDGRLSCIVQAYNDHFVFCGNIKGNLINRCHPAFHKLGLYNFHQYLTRHKDKINNTDNDL